MTARQWTGMVPVDDTALAVTDTGGRGILIIYLNGQFATQRYWRRVIAELGAGWRHITYERLTGNQRPSDARRIHPLRERDWSSGAEQRVSSTSNAMRPHASCRDEHRRPERRQRCQRPWTQTMR